MVWDDLASGMRYRLEHIECFQGGEPLDWLVESLMGPQPAPLRSPAEYKAGQMLEAALKYGGEGVIFLTPKYCDPILFNIPTLTQILKEHGVPALCLEMSGTLSEGQMRTRVEAFLEMISGSPFNV